MVVAAAAVVVVVVLVVAVVVVVVVMMLLPLHLTVIAPAASTAPQRAARGHGRFARRRPLPPGRAGVVQPPPQRCAATAAKT
jgi:hypothetical protein